MGNKKTGVTRTANQILLSEFEKRKDLIIQAIDEQGKALFSDKNILTVEDVQDTSVQFFELMIILLQASDSIRTRGSEFEALKQFFASLAKQIQARGGDLNAFILYVQALQRVLIEELDESGDFDFEQTQEMLLQLARIFNQLVLEAFNIYLQEKEEMIRSSEEELRKVSTPISEIWDGVLTLPIIGRLDSSRTMLVMENLLTRIEKDRAKVVVMDVTGVMTIDSQVSHYLIQMVRAIGLMGAKAILTGIRPDIARALTNLNIDFTGIVTRSTLADGLKEAFSILKIEVSDNKSTK